MKIEEIMVGDYLKITEPDKFAGFIGSVQNIGGPSKYLTMYLEPYHDVDVFIEDVEGIPLTAEILEKNFQEFLPGINLMYQLKGPYCAMNEDGQWVFGLVKVDGENSARYPLVKISFVHQLQHALRLCGIEKEIVLP